MYPAAEEQAVESNEMIDLICCLNLTGRLQVSSAVERRTVLENSRWLDSNWIATENCSWRAAS